MTRKLLPLAFVLALAAAACAEPSTPEVDVGSGVRFLPQVADALGDAGRHASVVVNEAGLPVVAYLGFEGELEEGEVIVARPVGAPSIPGVFLATASEQGYWTRGAIAIAEQIPNVTVAFNPAFEPSVAELTPANVTGLELVADGDTYHAVWGSSAGVFHATGSLDPATTTQAEVSQVTETPGLGPSIAVDGSGTPWIAYQSSTSAVATVEVATPEGEAWAIETIAEAAGCDTCSTAVVPTSAGVAVASSNGGDGVSVATEDGEGGWVSVEVSGSGGQGLAGAATNSGLGLSYYDAASGQVTLATGDAAGVFETTAVAEVAEGSASAAGAGTALAAGPDGSFGVAWADATEGVRLAMGEPTALEPIETGDVTAGGAFPSVAVAGDGSVAYLAWYAPEESDLLVGAYGEVGEVGFAVPSPTPTGPVAPPVAPPSRECSPVEGGTVTVVAEGVAFTEGSCIEVAAGAPFTIAFDNQDQGIPHNVQVFAGPEPSGELLVETEIITGPDQIDYEVPALEGGSYAFNCVVHPTQMVGTIEVGEGGGGDGDEGGGGTGGGETTVTASGIAFDTATIELAAGEPGTVRFVNQDAGVQHNIAIYPSADDLANALFRGELITGPDETEYAIDPLEAGEYYFHCDVHPLMNGTVTVT